MKALDIIFSVSIACSGLFSIERPCQKATNSEFRRWFKNKSVVINGETPNWDEEFDFPLRSLVLFPKSHNKKCTLI